MRHYRVQDMMRFVLAFILALACGGASANNVIINPFIYGGVTTLTRIDYGVGGSSIPASAEVGDVFVLILAAYGSTSGTTDPSGFTAITSAADSSFRYRLSYRVIQPGDAGDPISNTLGGSVVTSGGMLFRPDRTITTLTVASTAAEITDGNPGAQVITGSGALTPSLMFGFYACNCGGLVSISMSPSQEDEEDFPSISQRWRWIIYNQDDTPADVTVDLGDGGSDNGLASFRISVR